MVAERIVAIVSYDNHFPSSEPHPQTPKKTGIVTLPAPIYTPIRVSLVSVFGIRQAACRRLSSNSITIFGSSCLDHATVAKSITRQYPWHAREDAHGAMKGACDATLAKANCTPTRALCPASMMSVGQNRPSSSVSR